MAWHDTPLTRRLGIRLPIVQAPMAGGPTTPELVAAVSEAGGLGSIAGGGLTPETLRAAIRQVRRLTDRPFAVNLFAPLPAPSGAGTAEWAELLGVGVPEPVQPPRYEDQFAVVVEERVPVFSFTFGMPPLDGVDAVTIGTATTPEEAVVLEQAGVAAVVAQGYEAGGHRGTFLEPVERSLIGTVALVPQVADAVSVPVVAAGGISDGRGVAAALALGAHGVQVGTAFLATWEAATQPAHRQALGNVTSVTNVLTGRYARAVRTAVVARLEASGLRPPDYPLASAFLREAPMLAGQAGRLARPMPAADLVARLAAGAERVIRSMA